MKQILFLIGFSFLSAQAYAVDFDGCYLLANPGVAYPSICISGTNEEGISGSNARLTVFEHSHQAVKACFKSSGLSIDSQGLRFEINGRTELTLTELSEKEGTLVGTAIIGSSRAKFFKVASAHAEKLQLLANDQCK